MGETEKPVVAFLGPKASYTHQATLSTFSEPEYTLQPSTSIEDVFIAVSSGTAEYGVVPFENSSNGSVIFTLELLKGVEDVRVSGEVYLAVRHCLLGYSAPTPGGSSTRRDSTSSKERRYDLPWRRLGASSSEPENTTTNPSPLTNLRKLYSHPQAWGQCTQFLTQHLKSTERLDVSSTSKAAELVSQSQDPSLAAISSSIAATLYPNLQILAQGIEDHQGNSTRFFILQRKSTTQSQGKGEDDWKTLVSFTVSHEEPGALADSLAVFKKYGLNLTSINTRPSGAEPWHYVFFVEFKGRKLGDGEGGAVNEALEELGKVAESWRWLGSWENQLGK